MGEIHGKLRSNYVYSNFEIFIETGKGNKAFNKDVSVLEMFRFLHGHGIGDIIGEIKSKAISNKSPALLIVRFDQKMANRLKKLREPGFRLFNEQEFDKFVSVLENVIQKNSGAGVLVALT